MTDKLITICFFLCFILLWGCCKEKIDITRIEISTQAEVDYICDNLPDGDTFTGDIIIQTEQELDYKCLAEIKHVKGDLILSGPKTSVPFKNLESVIGDEVFSICDNGVDTICFPKLHTVINGLGLVIDSGCNFDNVLFVPEIRELTAIGISTPFFPSIKRSGTLLGFNLVEELEALSILGGDDGSQNVNIDGFYDLKKVRSQFNYVYINKKSRISDSSFMNLEEARFIKIEQLPDPSNYTDYTLEDFFPKLQKSDRILLRNFPPEDVCYLMESYLQGSIESLVIFKFLSQQTYNDDELSALCE